MSFFATVVIVSMLYCCMCEVFLPTESEARAALEFQTPSRSWGYQARQERNIRLFAIGGSNTRRLPYPSAIMADFESNTHPSWTAIMDRIGQGSVQAFEMVGRKFQFESLDHSSWPNIIMLEFSANIDYWPDNAIEEGLDTIITAIRRKYRVIGLPEPAIMFLELFSVRGLVDYMNTNPNATHSDKMALIITPHANYTVCGNVGNQICNCTHYLATHRVARFHNLPIVSWRELALQSFIRYYLASNTSFVDSPWELMGDSVHISVAGGKILYDTLLRPFFHGVMTSRREPVWNKSKYIASLGPVKRMYPVTNRTMDLFTEFGSAIDGVIKQPNEWVLANIHDREKLRCSSDPSAPLNLDIVIPKECEVLDTCTVSIIFLHSWNTSYTGHLSCELHSTHLLEKITVNSTLNENGDKVQLTGAVRSSWKTTVKAGNHLIKCNKLDSKLTCLVSFAASCIMEI